MANKFIIPAPPVVGGNVAGGTATLDLPIGPRYHAIWLKLECAFDAATTLSEACGLIKVKVNGRTQRQMTATQLNAVQSLMGPEFAAYITTAAAPNVVLATFGADGNAYQTLGDNRPLKDAAVAFANSAGYTTNDRMIVHLPIFFAEPWRKQYAAGEMMALPTSWPGKGLVATFQLEFVVGSLSATAPATSADVEIDYVPGSTDASGNPILLLTKWSQFNMVGFTANTDNYLTTLPRKDQYQSLHFFSDHASDVVSYVKVKLENNLIRDCNKARLDLVNVSRGMNPDAVTATRTDCVFDYTDAPDGALPMVYGGRQVQDFQVILQKSAVNATTCSVLALSFGPLD